MARKNKQDAASGLVIGIAIIAGIPIWLMMKASDAVGPVVVVIIFALLIVGGIYVKNQRHKARVAHLLSKYGDPSIVDRIMRQNIWEGQTCHQLVDSIGNPVTVDNHFLKTKKKETWKYHQDGKNRFKLRLILENDVVVGWEKRS